MNRLFQVLAGVGIFIHKVYGKTRKDPEKDIKMIKL